MLEQPMMDKLAAMRLHGMMDPLQQQQKEAGMSELSFLERLAMVVDHQWNWRKDQALARRLQAAKLRGNTCVEEIDFRAARGLHKSMIRGLSKESGCVDSATLNYWPTVMIRNGLIRTFGAGRSRRV